MLCNYIVFSIITLFIQLVYGVFEGRFAEEGEIPFAVCFVTGDHLTQSAGMIISNDKILASAVGLSNTASDLRVVAGVVDLTNKTSEWYQDSKIKSKIIHPKFEANHRQVSLYNIGVAILTNPFTYTDYVKPLGIVTNNEEKMTESYFSYAGNSEDCFSFGWGATEYDFTVPSQPVLKTRSEKLIVAGMVPQVYSACPNLTQSGSFDSRKIGMVCLYPSKPNTTMCEGDGGGGLVCGNLKHVYGILSDLFGMCGVYNPSIFLLISQYIKMYGMEDNVVSVSAVKSVHMDYLGFFVFIISSTDVLLLL